MATPGEIKHQIGERLRNIAGWEVYEYPPDAINPPCFIIQDDEPVCVYASSDGIGLDTWRFVIIAVVSRTSDSDGQKKVDEAADPHMVKATVEGGSAAAQSLGDAVGDIWVDKAGRSGVLSVGTVDYWARRIYCSAHDDSGVHTV